MGVLRQEEQAVLDRIVRDRRASLAPCGITTLRGPHILVSEASVQDFDEHILYPIRRASTQSMGPVVAPVSGVCSYSEAAPTCTCASLV